MRELKSFIVLYDGKFIRAYKKSEADKEIAKLKEQVSEERSAKVDYMISANDLSYVLEKAYAEIDHQKYKRCIELADNCALRAVVAKMENRSFPTRKNSWRMFIYPKWYKRWMELAEKFKPNN